MTTPGGYNTSAANTGKASTVAPGLNLVYLDGYASDPTGVSFSDGAMASAVAALGTSPGMIVLGKGAYKFANSYAFTSPEQGLTGPGSALTTLTYTGTGTFLNFWVPTFTASVNIGAPVGGFSINGFGAGAGSVGLRWGDLNRARVNDLLISGFNASASSIGLYLHNVNGWSEQGEWTAVNCILNSVNVCFDTNSFDYSVFQFVIDANSGQDGVRLQGSAQLQGARFEVRGNFNSGAGNTGAVLAFDRGVTAGTSQIGGQVLVDVECDGSTGLGHFSIVIGNNFGAGPIVGGGILRFNDGTIAFQGMSNPNSVTLSFFGNVNDHTLGLMQNGDAIAFVGSTDRQTIGTLATALFSGTIFCEAGDIYAFQLASGATAITITGTGTWGKKLDLFIAQPSSGGAGTATWTGVKWPAGAAPTLSATNGFVDHIRLTYLPNQSSWYGELVALHYA
jgi:hypothetical protein